MRVAIMQPTYLPWALMDTVDVFVLLDTVQFELAAAQQDKNQPRRPMVIRTGSL